MRRTSSLALSGLLAASLVPAMAQTVAPAPSNSAPIVTTSPGPSNGTSTTGINTDGTGTAAGTTAPAATAPATTAPATTGTSATGTVITPSMSGAALSNAGAPNANATTSNTAPGNTAAGNPAVDTTGAKPMAQPAKGANSFTEGQAKSRLAANGFTDISTLTKDADGVWRGRATKGGKTGDVWLDYRGNYGQP